MLRITSGILKGLYLSSPKNNNTRPTSEKIRQAIFNKISISRHDINYKCIYDLFAGSGALGLEASGLDSVTEVFFVEQDFECLKALNANVKFIEDNLVKQSIGMPQYKVLSGDITTQYKKLKDSGADLVFCDPPYEQGWFEKVDQLESSFKKIREKSSFIYESSKFESLPDESLSFTKLSMKIYGETCVHFYERKHY